MFPDAPTERGRRHLEGLAALASQGTPGGVLFLIQSAAVRGFLPDFHTDPAFAETFAACAPRLRVRALGVDWTPELSLRLPGRPVPFLAFAKEANLAPLLRRFDQAIRDMKASGEFHQILSAELSR